MSLTPTFRARRARLSSNGRVQVEAEWTDTARGVLRTTLLLLVAGATYLMAPGDKPAWVTIDVQYLAGLANCLAGVVLMQVDPIGRRKSAQDHDAAHQ